MEARPIRRQPNITKVHLFTVSLIMVVSFLSISFVTNNYNYTLASAITVIVINLSLIFKNIRKVNKKSF